MAEQNRTTQTILRRKQVEARTGLRRSSLYDQIRRGEFPAPVPIGRKSVGWLESEVADWITNCIEARKASDGRKTES